jgi:DNA-binding NtrC family response regulator
MICMDSVIQDYKEGNSIGASLEAFANRHPNHALANTMRLIYSILIGENQFENQIATINQLDYSQFKIEEQLMFLEYLFSLYVSKNRQSNANSILSVIKSLVSEKLSVEFQTLPINMQGLLDSNNGNKKNRSLAFEQCLEILKNKSKRYKVILWDYMIHLCFTHEFEKVQKNLSILKNEMAGTQIEKRFDFVLFLYDMERNNWENTEQHIRSIQEDSILAKFCRNTIEQYCKFKNNFIHQDESVLDQKRTSDWPHLSTVCLIKDKRQESLKWARKYAESNISFKSTTSDAYYLLRAELANGNVNAAEFFLENKKNIGNESPIDDFFKFRIHQIKRENDTAKYYFNKFLQYIDKVELHNRLDIELQLSPDLQMKDIRFFIENSIATNIIAKPAENFKNIKYKKETLTTEMHYLIGEHASILHIKELIKKFAFVELPVLIVGETGTGKELVAKALWQEGPYKNKKFVAINCGAISDYLLQSELFGHKKGAFTGAFQDHKGIFEEATEGIVFLDEIGEISSQMQVSLLRILESGEYRAVGDTVTKKLNCKIIFATNRNLEDQVKLGHFRKDLQFRLDRLSIHLPALRERTSDIPLLVNHFINIQNPNLPTLFFDKKLLDHLATLPWPGNIRELRNELEKIRLFHSDKIKIQISDLSEKYKEKKITVPQKDLGNKKAKVNSNANLLNMNSKFRKIDELKNLFKNYHKLSRAESASFLKVSLNTAANYLATLEKENYIKKIKSNNSEKIHYYEIN